MQRLWGRVLTPGIARRLAAAEQDARASSGGTDRGLLPPMRRSVLTHAECSPRCTVLALPQKSSP